MLSAYLAVGEVLKPQGVKGEMKIRPLTDDPERFWALKQVYLQRGDAYEACSVQCCRIYDGFVYLEMANISDRDAVEALRGTLLYVDRAHAVKPTEDAHFICDIIGCEGVDTQGKAYGPLVDVLQPGGNDVYVFQTPQGQMMVPALKFVVLSVDVAARRVVLDAERLTEVAVWEE